MVGYLITSVLSLATHLLPSIRASVQAPSSSFSFLKSINSKRGRAQAFEKDLERLMRTLEWIKATLYDADEREIRDRSVKLWLKELKKVAYDAEDVLSEYLYEVNRVHLEARKASEASDSHKRKKMEYIEYIVQIPDGMVDRLNKIRSRFDEIAKDRVALQLWESDGARRPNNKLLRPPTGHMVDEASIFGRDAEIEEVINLLLSEKEKPFSVISIIGKGGLGKTTIAQLVYKDERVTRCFDLLGWVCVSEEFDVGRLTKATIESVSKINSNLSELSSLQEKLAEIVKEKKILLVLDDVWNENRSLWDSLRVPFKEAKLVRILVTTRNKKVADVMQTTTYFRPTNMPEDSCWQLFQHYAFNGTSDTMPPHLVNMGKDIMRKCGGLPLAVKSIASLLSHETNEEDWREILESDLWESNSSNDIFPALQISYDHLPPHLKPCFLFCSMYPKDYILEKMNLIELWISHGYIESKGKRRITDTGVEYYEELKQRSFVDDFSSRSKERCKLHDIIHDLARLNSENEHYSVEINQPLDIQKENVPQEACHLYVGGFSGYVDEVLQQNMMGLRTLSINMSGRYGDLDYWYCNLAKFRALRVLELEGDFLEIPGSISELKHLTHLNIIKARYLETLPLSIGLLYNLQTLILDCDDDFEYLLDSFPKLKHQTLLLSIGHLYNLQTLILYCYSLEYLPESIGSLSNLRRLIIETNNPINYLPHGLVNFPAIKSMKARVIVGNVAWLKDMTDLEGNLTINGVSNLKDAQRANMRNKCKLEAFYINCDPDNDYEDECVEFDYEDDWVYPLKSMLEITLKPEISVHDADFSWLESLQPHPNLKKLGVGFYSSATMPGWMCDPCSLQSIQEISLNNCDKIQSLSFNNLHTLKHLVVHDCHGLRVLQLEQMSSQLEKLEIFRCRCLELITVLGNLDMLATLKISNCEVLKSITMDGLQSVESTEPIGDSSHGKPRIGRQSISTLTRLEISLNNCDKIQSLPFNNLHTLKRLIVHNCSGFRVLQLEQLSSQLEKLKISDLPCLELITGLGNLDMLATLEIYRCEVLKSITMDGLQLAESTEPIGDSSHGKPRIGRQSISTLTRLEIKYCELLCVLPDGWTPSIEDALTLKLRVTEPFIPYVRVLHCNCTDIEVGDLQ
ncbi:putative disease resistance protein RGA3 [Carex rostrata]